jgi:TonB family protein
MISLADLRARNVAPTWQEAVAVVQELIQTVAATGQPNRIPDLEHVALIPNGDVVSLPGGPAPDNPVRHAAILLQLLLDTAPAPPQLQEFIERNVADPPQHDNVPAFSQGLAYYERPGRRSDVEALVRRAMEAEAQTRAEQELRRLKERAQQVAEQPKPKDEPASSRRFGRPPTPVLIGVILVLAVGVGATYWWVRSRSVVSAKENQRAAVTAAPAQPSVPDTKTSGAKAPESTPPSPASSLPAAPSGSPTGTAPPLGGEDVGFLQRTKSAVVYAYNRLIGAPIVRQAPPAPAASAVEPTVKRTRKSRRTPSGGHTNDAPPTNAPEVYGEIAHVLEVPMTLSDLSSSVATAAVFAGAVYAPGDPDVVPPVMVRPALPAAPPPDVPLDQIGTLELLVDEQGDVENVRLVSPGNRFHDRMIVASAKTWKFRPATKDGRGVKFRTRVRITI